jgi:hypothetical protein
MEIIKARLPDGSARDIEIRVSEDAPWAIEFKRLDGTMRRIEAGDLFEALREMRRDFESAGCLLCVLALGPTLTHRACHVAWAVVAMPTLCIVVSQLV